MRSLAVQMQHKHTKKTNKQTQSHTHTHTHTQYLWECDVWQSRCAWSQWLQYCLHGRLSTCDTLFLSRISHSWMNHLWVIRERVINPVTTVLPVFSPVNSRYPIFVTNKSFVHKVIRGHAWSFVNESWILWLQCCLYSRSTTPITLFLSRTSHSWMSHSWMSHSWVIRERIIHSVTTVFDCMAVRQLARPCFCHE